MKKALLVVCFIMTAALVFAGGGQAGGAGTSSTADRSKWVTDRKVEYSWLIQNTLDPNTTPFWQKMEEISNVHINWQSVAPDNFANYVNLMWAGGDYPDIASSLSNIPYYAEQGVFYPINTTWEKNMPNLMKIFKEHPEAPAFLKYSDGNTYGFPAFEELNIQISNGIWIYKPWLDKLGLAVPTTLDEFVNILQAFKTRDPNGNGIADEIPFAWDGRSSWTYGTVHSWFGAMKDWLIRDAQAVYSPSTENYKQYVQFMNRLQSLGLFDPELFTQDSNTFYAKGRRSPTIYGVIMHYGLYLVADDSTYDDYIYLAPMKTGTNPSGAGNDRYYKNNFIIWPDSNGVVFKTVKDPDTLEKWYDIIYDPYYGSQVRYGMDGVHIKLNANNQFEQITTPPSPYQNFADWYFATHFQMTGYNTRALCDPIYNMNRESREAVIKDEFYEPYFFNEPMPFIPQTSAESEKISRYPDIGKLVNDMTPQWISGERDINRDWPEYLRQLDQLGLKDYTAAYQSYVTRVRNQLGSNY